MQRSSELAQFEQATLPHLNAAYNLARWLVRNDQDAEDVVQDTLLSALSGSGFSGKSSVRTWLTGILKHKIVDAIRRKQRDAVPIASLAPEGSELELDDVDALFREDGTWDTPPAAWGNPEEALNRREFFDILDFCLEKLPAATARVFMMREVLELDSEEICKELAITANNLWVILYRARVALRMCLEENWFASGGRT